MYPNKKLLRFDFPSYKYVKQINCSIHIFHGTNDGVIPFASGKKLFGSILQKEKTFYIIEKGGHNNLIEFDAYLKQFIKILQ